MLFPCRFLLVCCSAYSPLPNLCYWFSILLLSTAPFPVSCVQFLLPFPTVRTVSPTCFIAEHCCALYPLGGYLTVNTCFVLYPLPQLIVAETSPDYQRGWTLGLVLWWRGFNVTCCDMARRFPVLQPRQNGTDLFILLLRFTFTHPPGGSQHTLLLPLRRKPPTLYRLAQQHTFSALYVGSRVPALHTPAALPLPTPLV